MENKRGTLSKLLSLITYKKGKKQEDFYIPELEEEKENRQEGNAGNRTKNKGGGFGGNSGKSQENSGESNIKKPVPVSELNKAEEPKKPPAADDSKISTDINANIVYLKTRFNVPDNKDFIIRQFTVAGGHKAFLAYIDGMADRITINNFILRPLLSIESLSGDDYSCRLELILQSVLETNQADKVNDPNEAIYEILLGNTLLYLDKCDFYITNETKGYDKREVSTPQVEGLVKGPQEAFNENLRTNLTLIRRIIKNHNLTTEFFRIGETSKTLCAVMYIKGLINPALIKEIKRRLKGVKTDFLANSGMLEQMLEESPWHLFPSVLSTERPDRTASHIVEGKFAVFLDGTPYTIIAPVTLHSMLHSPEDAALKWQYATAARFIRLFAVFVATLLPGMYVAITNFHQEMIPTDLLIAIAKAKENVPFPTILEVLLMEMSFELIREAGIRVPGLIGNTLGIIGALILGQAAVQANIVSPVLIIIVAITGLGNFAIPNFSLAYGVRILRLFFIIAGAVLGFYGIAVGIVIVASLIMSMKSFGVPFFAPVSPKTKRSYDVIIRWPLIKQAFIPDYVNPQGSRRQPHIAKEWTQKNPKNTGKGGGSNDKGR